MREPDNTRYHNREKFLPLNAYTPGLAELHMRGPPALKPFPVKMTPKTNRPCGISLQFQVRGRGNGSV